jgi:NADPH:quinone reductase-like Zn-dependent oxidoreductase
MELMKAVFIRKYGGIEVLEYGDRPRPKPKPTQVLVEVHAASVNPRDWLLRQGRYIFRYLMPNFPLILGSDISGVVVETGLNARRFQPGSAVFGMQTALGGMGGYAEYIAIDESALAPLPDNITHLEAAGVPCAGLTAFAVLSGIARVEQGMQVAINGASGGVGTYAVQFAKAMGATVTAITSTANLDFVKSLGADRVIDYKEQKFTATLTNQDLVFDTIGRESLSKCSSVLKSGGRYVTTIPNFTNLLQGVTSKLMRLVSFNTSRSAHTVLVPADGKALELIASLMSSGRVRTIIDSVYPLSEAQAAHEKSRTWRARGKILLQVRE